MPQGIVRRAVRTFRRENENPHPVSAEKLRRRGWGNPLPSLLLCGCFRWGCRSGGRSFGGDFGRRYGIDLHGRQDLLQTIEDLVAVNVLDEAVTGGVRRDVQ